MKGYFGRLLISLDQLLNVLLFNGFPDETISSRLGREKRYGDSAGDAGCAVLDVFEDQHCEKSIEETPEGEIQSHHSGRVIRELPRDPATRLHKVPVLIAALALFMVG